MIATWTLESVAPCGLVTVIAIPERAEAVGARVPAGFCVAGAGAGFCVVGAGAGAVAGFCVAGAAGAWAYTPTVTTPARRELISSTFRISSIIV